MARYWGAGRNQEEEEEEEALSLSDLPINLVKTEETQLRRESDEEGGGGGGGGEEEGSGNSKEHEKEEPEFDFGWWGNNGPRGSLESQMCAADELFFKGQILPLRLSVSSDNGLVFRSMSRSESMDHGSVSRFIGSRSSSIGSYHSSSSSSTNSSSAARPATAIADYQKPPYRGHHFHTHPGPKPKSLNASSGYRQSSLRSSQSQSRFPLWDFFRTGLVRGPGSHIELWDLKLRSSSTNKTHSAIIRNSSNGSNGDDDVKSGSGSIRTGQGFRFNRKIGGLLGGASCKCSVETVTLNAPTAKMGLAPVGNAMAGKINTEGKLRKQSKTKMKQAMSRQRTSEWLKELSLSHAKLAS